MKIWTLPNCLSFLRILAVPFLIYCFHHQQYEAFFWIFIAASLSDTFDGLFARWLNAHSDLGKILDPIADKFFVLSLLILFGLHGLLPWWFISLLLGRDIMIMGGVWFLKRQGKAIPMTASWPSKINTGFQMGYLFWIIAMLAYPQTFGNILPVLFYIVLGCTLYSWYDYWKMFLTLKKGSSHPARAP